VCTGTLVHYEQTVRELVYGPGLRSSPSNGTCLASNLAPPPPQLGQGQANIAYHDTYT